MAGRLEPQAQLIADTCCNEAYATPKLRATHAALPLNLHYIFATAAGCQLSAMLQSLGSIPWLRPRWFLAAMLASIVTNTSTLQHTDEEHARTGFRMLPDATNATLRVTKASMQQHVLRIRLRSHALRTRKVPQSLLQLGAAAKDNPALRGPPPESIVGTVYVGLPPQELTVIFDSGSGNVIFPSKSCHSMACISHRAYDSSMSTTREGMATPLMPQINGVKAAIPGGAESLHLSFATGTVVGSVVQDKVCLGADETVCSATGLIEATQMSDEPFSLFPFDGIIGLGLPNASIDRNFNFLENLAEAQAMASNRFAVWFAIEGDDEDSEITFGALSEARMESSDLVWLQLSKTSTMGMWQTSMSDVAVGMVKMHLCNHDCQVAFDTGSGVIAGPSIFIDAVLAGLNVMVDCANFNSLPTLGFVFGSTTFNIDPADYVRKTTSGCYHQFLAYDLPQSAQPVVLLGAPFLRRYYTVYDSTSLQVGVAFAKHKASTKPQETSTEAAARLMIRPPDPAGHSSSVLPGSHDDATGQSHDEERTVFLTTAVTPATGEAATGEASTELLATARRRRSPVTLWSASERPRATAGFASLALWLWYW